MLSTSFSAFYACLISFIILCYSGFRKSFINKTEASKAPAALEQIDIVAPKAMKCFILEWSMADIKRFKFLSLEIIENPPPQKGTIQL